MHEHFRENTAFLEKANNCSAHMYIVIDINPIPACILAEVSVIYMATVLIYLCLQFS